MDESNTPTGIQFKVGNSYSNDIGEYKVLTMSDRQMRVEYSNGERAVLTMSLQEKIVSRRLREADAEERRRLMAEAENERLQAAAAYKEENRKAMAAAARKADMR